MDPYELHRLFAQRPAGHNYFELIRVPSMSAGLYVLAAGEADPQQPHRENELYYIVNGHATIRVGGQDRLVQPGTVVYVPGGVEHSFHTITEELQVLVIFAPAETVPTS